jgi:hypothetical protein
MGFEEESYGIAKARNMLPREEMGQYFSRLIQKSRNTLCLL